MELIQSTVSRCPLKAKILSASIQGDLEVPYERTSARQTDGVVEIIYLFKWLDFSKLVQSNSLREKVESYVMEKYFGRWIELERDAAVQNALVNDTLQLIEKIGQQVGKRQ